MKIFVNDGSTVLGKNQYNFCNDNEILFLPILQNGFGHLVENSMVGVTSLEKTTEIKVVDLKINRKFLEDIFITAYQNLYDVKIDVETGCFDYRVYKDFLFPANIFEDIDEILDKAKCFGHEEKLFVNGREFFKK